MLTGIHLLKTGRLPLKTNAAGLHVGWKYNLQLLPEHNLSTGFSSSPLLQDCSLMSPVCDQDCTEVAPTMFGLQVSVLFWEAGP